MENFSEHLTSVKAAIIATAQNAYSRVEQQIPENLEQHWHTYVKAISNTSKDSLLEDISQFKVTPATVTLSVTTIATLVLANKLFSTKKATPAAKSKKKKKKKLTKAQKANTEIQSILDYVEETYVPQIDDYLENYASLKETDRQYKYKYYEEMLLKELLKLDGVDVAGNDVLRDNRKKVIRFIQDHQKRLDKFKKDVL